ncbi:MAG: hypothetical protein QXU81_08580 [Candidatus Bathyarchaeia archaeon]
MWELSGKYMAWPGFSKVKGAEILFDEKNDIIEIEDIGDKTAVFQGLIKASSEAKENTVEALRRGIHMQVILKDTLTKEPLELTLMNIAVVLYTKAGGIPWILREPLILTRGLFVGISLHIDHKMKNIYYGVMEVFDKYEAHLICRARMYKCPHRIRSVKGLFIPREDVEKNS